MIALSSSMFIPLSLLKRLSSSPSPLTFLSVMPAGGVSSVLIVCVVDVLVGGQCAIFLLLLILANLLTLVLFVPPKIGLGIEFKRELRRMGWSRWTVRVLAGVTLYGFSLALGVSKSVLLRTISSSVLKKSQVGTWD